MSPTREVSGQNRKQGNEPKGESNINSQKQTEVILRTTGLTKKFGKRTAVNNLNLEIRKGEVFGFLGPNGSGKSTTVSMIVGLIKPDRRQRERLRHGPERQLLAHHAKTGSNYRVPGFLPLFKRPDNLELFSIAIGGIPFDQNQGSAGTGEPGRTAPKTSINSTL